MYTPSWLIKKRKRMQQAAYDNVGKTIEGLKNNTIKSICFMQGLDLTSNQITALCRFLKNNQSVTDICFHCQHIGIQASVALASALETNHSVVSLTINFCKGVNGYAIIIALLKNMTLKSISFHASNLDDNAAIAIAQVLKTNNSIQSINLNWNNITDKGGQAIAEALTYNQSLCEIQLEHNRMTNASIPYFEKMLRQNIHLEKLEINLQGRESEDNETGLNTGSIGQLLKENLVAKNYPIAQANLLALRNHREVNVPSLLDISMFAVKRYTTDGTLPKKSITNLPNHILQKII